MNRAPFKGVIALALAAAAMASAQAAETTYFGFDPNSKGSVTGDPFARRNAFKDALAALQTENFDAQTPVGGSLGNQLAPIFLWGGLATLSTDNVAGTTSRIQNTAGSNPGGGSWTGRFNTTGDPQVDNTSATPPDGRWVETNKQSTTVQFTTAVNAFGAFLTDMGDFDGSVAVDVFADASSTSALYTRTLLGGVTAVGNGGLAFFGYTNDAASFTKVVFTLTQAASSVGGYDFVGFDDFITGTLRSTVPEPTSLALVGLSLALLGCSRRRKKEV